MTAAAQPKPSPAVEARNQMGGRWAAAGMPTEKSKDFRGASRRLLTMMGPERKKAALVLVLVVGSVTLSVIGPRILGHATDVLFTGLRSPQGIDFDELHRTLYTVIALYAVSSVMAYSQGYLLAGVVQRTMYRLRAEVEDKLNRLPLKYVDGQPRGDLLRRSAR
jgi:ATP-binding cassette subfamily B protein